MKNGLAHLLFLFEAHDRIRDSTATQLSLVVTLLVSAAGTWLAQLTVRLVGQVRLGGVVSWRVGERGGGEEGGSRWGAHYLRKKRKRLAGVLELVECPYASTVTHPPHYSLRGTTLVC